VHDHKRLGGDTDCPAEPSAKTIHRAAQVRPRFCFALHLHLGNLVHFHSMLMCKSVKGWAPTPKAQLNIRPRQFTGPAPGREPRAACMSSAPGTLVPFYSLIYRQVTGGLSGDTYHPAQPSAKAIHRATYRLRPIAACIATAPGTLVLFHSVHGVEGLSADTEHPAEPSAKTIHRESSGSNQVMLCFDSAPGELRSLSFYAYVQVYKGLGADTDHSAQP